MCIRDRYKDERYKKNTVVELDKLPAREGYTFTGWYADEELTDRITSIKMTSDKTVYAGWESTGVPAWLNGDDHFSYAVGYSDGTVRPLNQISRAEVATIFFRLLTDETRDEYWSKTNSYTDVPADSWFNNAISTLSNMGIIDGYADGSFRPDAPITRAEFTKIAVSFFEYADYVYENTFTDVRSGSWYTQFIAAAVEIGLIEGYPDGTFRPDNYITRAEACTIVNRTLNRAPDEDHLLPESVMITWPDNQPGTWYYADMQEATNSHDYDWLGSIEDWTEKLEERDWEALEKLWSDSHDAPGGEVMG